MRKKDDLHWVKKVEKIILKNIKNGIVSIVTDIRFPNEIEYINKIGGKVIHLEMVGNKPANEYEAKNDPALKQNSDVFLIWKKYGDSALLKCQKRVKTILKEISE